MTFLNTHHGGVAAEQSTGADGFGPGFDRDEIEATAHLNQVKTWLPKSSVSQW
jgi:hypothetical protein